MNIFFQIIAIFVVFGVLAGVGLLGYWFTGWASRRAGLKPGEAGSQWGYSDGGNG